MEVLKELEKKLGIQPLNFDLFLGNLEISSPEDNSEEPIIEVETPKSYNFTQDNFRNVANYWGVDAVTVHKLYNQVKYYYDNSGDGHIKDICFRILKGLYYNNLTRNQVNQLIAELRA